MPPKKLLNLTTHRTIQASTPTPQIFDGKRPRTLWHPSHGDGDPSANIANRSLNLRRGHPTWKVFCGDISLPITRPGAPVTTTTASSVSPNVPAKSTRKRKSGSTVNDSNPPMLMPIPTTTTSTGPDLRHPSEPPRYVYLDDHAAHIILASHAYTNAELRTFWPFDFDNRGGVKAGRGNRGKAAMFGESEGGGFATWVTQGKARMYMFCGGADISVLKSFPSNKPAEVEKHDAKKEDKRNSTPDQEHLSPDSSSTDHQNEPRIPLYHAHIPYTLHPPVVYTSGPTDGTLKPLGIAARAIQGSPYFEQPCARFRANPRSRPGDLAVRLGVVVGGKRGGGGEDGGTREKGRGGKRVKIEDGGEEGEGEQVKEEVGKE